MAISTMMGPYGVNGPCDVSGSCAGCCIQSQVQLLLRGSTRGTPGLLWRPHLLRCPFNTFLTAGVSALTWAGKQKGTTGECAHYFIKQVDRWYESSALLYDKLFFLPILLVKPQWSQCFLWSLHVTSLFLTALVPLQHLVYVHSVTVSLCVSLLMLPLC